MHINYSQHVIPKIATITVFIIPFVRGGNNTPSAICNSFSSIATMPSAGARAAVRRVRTFMEMLVVPAVAVTGYIVIRDQKRASVPPPPPASGA